MALILAIESDRRQVTYLTAMVRGRLRAELVLGDSAEDALQRLGDRVPDLILASALLSPKDEQALGDRLRRLNGVAAHVQTLTLPVLGPPAPQTTSARGGVLSALLGDRGPASAPDGCDPAVFAEQCQEYLRRAEEEKDARRHDEDSEHPETDADEGIAIDVDLSDLLEEEQVPRRARAADVDDEPAVYDLSAAPIDLDLVAAPREHRPAAAADPDADDFNDWRKVVDALKRESAQVRVPRERKPGPRGVQAAAAAPAPAPKIAADPPRRRLRIGADEWGMFDPAQAGMAALYERLEQITQEKKHR